MAVSGTTARRRARRLTQPSAGQCTICTDARGQHRRGLRGSSGTRGTHTVMPCKLAALGGAPGSTTREAAAPVPCSAPSMARMLRAALNSIPGSSHDGCI